MTPAELLALAPGDRVALHLAELERHAREWTREILREDGARAEWSRLVFVEERGLPDRVTREERSAAELAPYLERLLTERRHDWVNLTARAIRGDALVVVVDHQCFGPVGSVPFVHVMYCGPYTKGFLVLPEPSTTRRDMREL